MAQDAPSPTASVQAYLARGEMRAPMSGRDVAELRREHREEALAGAGKPPSAAVTEVLTDTGVPGRLYHRAGDDSAAVTVWFHGGGWALGDLDCCDAVARALASEAHCAVLTVDYRLAPEHRFPAAVDDAWAATTWAADRFSHVAVGGDSAGGNLAAAVALRARDAHLPLALQLLVYPVLDWRPDSLSYREFARCYQRFAGQHGFGRWYREAIRYLWEAYCPEPAQRLSPQASPLQAPDLRGVAPALIISAEHDILRVEAGEYAHRLRECGVSVETVLYAGQIHGFFELQGVFDDARNAISRSAATLTRVLGASHTEINA